MASSLTKQSHQRHSIEQLSFPAFFLPQESVQRTEFETCSVYDQPAWKKELWSFGALFLPSEDAPSIIRLVTTLGNLALGRYDREFRPWFLQYDHESSTPCSQPLLCNLLAPRQVNVVVPIELRDVAQTVGFSSFTPSYLQYA